MLRQGIQGISDLISQTGIINLDFADVKAVMESGGMAHLGIGVGKGEKAMADAPRRTRFPLRCLKPALTVRALC